MLAILLLEPSFYAYLGIAFYGHFILINHLNEILFLSVPLYLVELPLFHLISQVLNFFVMGLYFLFNLFLPKVLFLEFLKEGVVDLF